MLTCDKRSTATLNWITTLSRLFMPHKDKRVWAEPLNRPRGNESYGITAIRFSYYSVTVCWRRTSSKQNIMKSVILFWLAQEIYICLDKSFIIILCLLIIYVCLPTWPIKDNLEHQQYGTINSAIIINQCLDIAKDWTQHLGKEKKRCLLNKYNS